MWTELYNFFRCIPVLCLIIFLVVLFIIGWVDWVKQLRKNKKNTQIQIAGDNAKQEQIMYIKEEENEHN